MARRGSIKRSRSSIFSLQLLVGCRRRNSFCWTCRVENQRRYQRTVLFTLFNVPPHPPIKFLSLNEHKTTLPSKGCPAASPSPLRWNLPSNPWCHKRVFFPYWLKNVSALTVSQSLPSVGTQVGKRLGIRRGASSVLFRGFSCPAGAGG